MVENKKISDAVETALDKMKPYVANITFGGVMGYCSGVAMKKVGKAVAVAIGFAAMTGQVLVATGYLDIDWAKIKYDAVQKIDQDKDGSITVKDLKLYWAKFKNLMVHKIPSAGGFSVGFLFGVRYG